MPRAQGPRGSRSALWQQATDRLGPSPLWGADKTANEDHCQVLRWTPTSRRWPHPRTEGRRSTRARCRRAVARVHAPSAAPAMAWWARHQSASRGKQIGSGFLLTVPQFAMSLCRRESRPRGRARSRNRAAKHHPSVHQRRLPTLSAPRTRQRGESCPIRAHLQRPSSRAQQSQLRALRWHELSRSTAVGARGSAESHHDRR